MKIIVSTRWRCYPLGGATIENLSGLYKELHTAKSVIMIRTQEINVYISPICRFFISGCSQAGKTYFAHQLLRSRIFDYRRVYYFHPDFHETNPVDWNMDIIFGSGLPSVEDILAMPEYSCLIFDDLFHECKDSKVIDYLYRVLSSKRKLHCIVMTQRYFSKGRYALNIRNSSNFHVLMRNADELANGRAARTMNLQKQYQLCQTINSNQLWPYCFIDKTNFARVNGIQIYIDIFSKYPKVVMKSGLYYLISENDFKKSFKLIDATTAVEHESQKSEKVSDSHIKTEKVSDIKTEKVSDTKSKTKAFVKSKLDFERRVRQIIRRHKKRSLL